MKTSEGICGGRVPCGPYGQPVEGKEDPGGEEVGGPAAARIRRR